MLMRAKYTKKVWVAGRDQAPIPSSVVTTEVHVMQMERSCPACIQRLESQFLRAPKLRPRMHCTHSKTEEETRREYGFQAVSDRTDERAGAVPVLDLGELPLILLDLFGALGQRFGRRSAAA